MLQPYAIDKDLTTQIEKSFKYHPPFGDQPERYIELRDKARDLALLIGHYTPRSREQSLALTKLEEAVMWANASIARNETDPSA